MAGPLPPYQKRALLLAALILCTALGSLCFLLREGWEQTGKDAGGSQRVAELYQNGSLLMRIPLSGEESRTFTITGENGAYNEIQVAEGAICVLSASCPDKLCVRRGRIRTSLLPIVCLPNRLVIRIREADPETSPDALTY